MTHVVSTVPRRPRQHYDKSFKAELVAACQQPGASVAAIAMANLVNANILRRWIKLHEARQAARPAKPPAAAAAPAIVPVSVQPTTTHGDIHCEIRLRQSVIHITWPASEATACARWLRELMQ